MKHVNLMPIIPKKSFVVKINFFTVLVLLVVMFVSAFYFIQYSKNKYQDLNAKKTFLLEKLTTLESSQPLNAPKVDEEGKSRTLLLSTILKDVSRRTPAEIRLDKLGFKADEKAVLLDASAANQHAFNGFKDAFSRTNWCGNAQVVSLALADEKDQYQMRLLCPME